MRHGRAGGAVFTYDVELEPHGVPALSSRYSTGGSRSMRRNLERLRDLLESA